MIQWLKGGFALKLLWGWNSSVWIVYFVSISANRLGLIFPDRQMIRFAWVATLLMMVLWTTAEERLEQGARRFSTWLVLGSVMLVMVRGVVAFCAFTAPPIGFIYPWADWLSAALGPAIVAAHIAGLRPSCVRSKADPPLEVVLAASWLAESALFSGMWAFAAAGLAAGLAFALARLPVRGAAPIMLTRWLAQYLAIHNILGGGMMTGVACGMWVGTRRWMELAGDASTDRAT